MSKFKEYLKNYAQKELQLSNFDKTNFGKSTLTLLNDLADLCKDDPNSMKTMLELLPRLVDRIPIAAITEDDFPADFVIETDQAIKRCARYPQVYQTADGKYWDDRAVAFQKANDHPLSKMYLYGSKHNSKQEVTLPYYPIQSIEIID